MARIKAMRFTFKILNNKVLKKQLLKKYYCFYNFIEKMIILQ